MKSLLVWSTMLFASVATACSASPPGPSPGTGGDIEIGRGAAVPFSDPGDGMAKSLAQTEAIPLAEARRRLVVQHEGSILADKLRGIYGEKFAGAMFERTPPGHVRFYFANIDLAEVRKALPTLGASVQLLSLVRLETVAETEAQMRATAIRMDQLLRAGGIKASVAISVVGGGYKISTLEPEKAAEALRLGGVKPASKVEYERAAPVVITVN